MAEPMVLEIEEVDKPRKSRAVTKANGGDAPMMFGFTAAQIAELPTDKIDHILQMQERTRAEDARKAYNAAMNAAQSEMGRISAEATNPQTRSKYASYAQLDRVLRPIYARHGFAISFDTAPDAPEGHVRVLAMLTHDQGHERKPPFHADIPIVTEGFKGTAMMTRTHAVASAMTYGQRYLLKFMFNVAIGESDDDGNGAGSSQPSGMVSEKQADELLRLITEKKMDAARVYKWVGMKLKAEPKDYPATVSDIPARLYPEVVAQIKAAK